MDAKRFDEILHETVLDTVETLASKAKEYAKGDRLYNFKRAATILDTTPEKALAGMIAKHLVSVLDLIEGTLPATQAMLNEKIGDTINYLILLKALLLENTTPQVKPAVDFLKELNKANREMGIYHIEGSTPGTETDPHIKKQFLAQDKPSVHFSGPMQPQVMPRPTLATKPIPHLGEVD